MQLFEERMNMDEYTEALLKGIGSYTIPIRQSEPSTRIQAEVRFLMLADREEQNAIADNLQISASNITSSDIFNLS